jgi:hypothetical protein
MAFVMGKSAMVSAPSQATLSRAPYDRQRDVYRLAKMGNKSCQRLWNDFERQDPGGARLVVSDVDTDEHVNDAATRRVDKALECAEKSADEPRRGSDGDDMTEYLVGLARSGNGEARSALIARGVAW